MGWTISHGTGHLGREVRSYTIVDNLARQLAHVLPGREWAELAPIFDRPDAEPFDVSPRQAGRCADLLDKAANHRRMPRDWGGTARDFAAAARRASNAGQMWRWS